MKIGNHKNQSRDFATFNQEKIDEILNSDIVKPVADILKGCLFIDDDSFNEAVMASLLTTTEGNCIKEKDMEDLVVYANEALFNIIIVTLCLLGITELSMQDGKLHIRCAGGDGELSARRANALGFSGVDFNTIFKPVDRQSAKAYLTESGGDSDV